MVERGIADPAVAGSIPVAPWTKFEEFDTLAEWLRRQPAKLVGSARTGSNPVGVVLSQLGSGCGLSGSDLIMIIMVAVTDLIWWSQVRIRLELDLNQLLSSFARDRAIQDTQLGSAPLFFCVWQSTHHDRCHC